MDLLIANLQVSILPGLVRLDLSIGGGLVEDGEEVIGVKLIHGCSAVAGKVL